MKNIIEFLHNVVLVGLCSTLTVALIYGLSLIIWLMATS